MKETYMVRGIIYGIFAGLVSTIVLDIASLILFAVMGESLSSFFALIGRSFLTLIGVNATEPVWQGITLHYSIGILTGLVLGLATQIIPKLQFSSYRKGILTGILIAQIEGNALFYLMSVILKIPQSTMMVIYGLGFILHLIWGACLGLIIAYGQQRKTIGWLHQKHEGTAR